MTLHITRSQFPVGQGCFHAGLVSLEEGSNALHYIYDCGSRNQRHLRRQISRYREHTSSVDALFVSHFDSDHVSGLDEFLGAVSVETVYIPYVNDIVLLLDIMEAEMDGNISASLIEISFNPASWFGLRGVRRVVRVLPGTPNALELDDEGNVDPENGELRFVGSPEPKTVARGRHTRALRGRSELLTMDRGSVRVHFRNRFTGWALVPYVHPVCVVRMRDFKRRLRSTLQLQSGQMITSAVLADALRDPSTRKALRECYVGIISGGVRRLHNRTSLSLYSGPTKQIDRKIESVCRIFPRGFPAIFPFSQLWMSRDTSEQVGWLGTGDADLNTDDFRKEWQKAYKGVQSQVATLLLPHHGSRRSFHPDLLDFPNLDLCVASAARPSQYMHPSEETIDTINRRGKTFVHVSQHFESEFVEHISIRY